MIILIVINVVLLGGCVYLYGMAKMNADDGIQAVNDLSQARKHSRQLEERVDELVTERDRLQAERDVAGRERDLWRAAAYRIYRTRQTASVQTEMEALEEGKSYAE